MSSSTSEHLDHLDYYAILGLTREATQVEVRRAYKALALQWHPDKHGGNDERFKKISAAYQVLSDTSARHEYDMVLDEAQRQQQRPRSPGRYQQQQQQYPPFGHQHQQYDRFATMGMMGAGMPDPFAHFNFAFRAADDVFRSVFGPDFSGFASSTPSHPHPNSLFDSMFAPMPMMMPGMPPPFLPMPSLMAHHPFGPVAAAAPPPHAMLHHHHHFALPAGSSAAVSVGSSSNGRGTGGFFSTSTTRTVDHTGNVIEETVTVDPSGNQKVVRKVNGVEQAVSSSSQVAIAGPYEVPVITSSGRSRFAAVSGQSQPQLAQYQQQGRQGQHYQTQQQYAQGTSEARRYRRE